MKAPNSQSSFSLVPAPSCPCRADRASVCGPRHIKRRKPICRTTLSCPLHSKGYVTHHAGDAFGAARWELTIFLELAVLRNSLSKFSARVHDLSTSSRYARRRTPAATSCDLAHTVSTYEKAVPRPTADSGCAPSPRVSRGYAAGVSLGARGLVRFEPSRLFSTACFASTAGSKAVPGVGEQVVPSWTAALEQEPASQGHQEDIMRLAATLP